MVSDPREDRRKHVILFSHFKTWRDDNIVIYHDELMSESGIEPEV